MFITMHCGGIPFNGGTIKDRSLGGSETAAYYVAKALADRGHKVTLFTNSQDEGTFDGVRYIWAGNLSEGNPLGDRFTFYAENTPCDLMIVQRHPQAFARRYASKVNFLWLHDLALQRAKGGILGQAWNVDRFLTVSKFHKAQVVKEWGLAEEAVTPIRNGIDPSLFVGHTAERNVNALVYSSRPERGLENLVKPGGIMERLAKEAPQYHLFVCGYDNTTPQMRDFYEYLWKRCDELPNVTNVGALTKAQLAEMMCGSGALLYPTTFEEVSCITAMEAMAAGLPFISSAHAALPETCEGSGSYLIPLKDGAADEDKFVEFFSSGSHASTFSAMSEAQRAAAREFGWADVARMIEDEAREVVSQSKIGSVMHHFIRHSDIVAFDKLAGKCAMTRPFERKLKSDSLVAYDFYHKDYFAKHYAAYYQYEKDRGVNYGPEDVSHTPRYGAVAALVGGLDAGATVLDYGCAHGHFTVNLAKQFPHLKFIGIDLTESNIATARKWADDEKLDNVQFFVGDATREPLNMTGNLVIAAEVIEHVAEPGRLVDNLVASSVPGGQVVITTPYGPWEAQGYTQHGYWRAHLHHFERADLHEMFGHLPEFRVIAAAAGTSAFGGALGSYITSFRVSNGGERCAKIDYERKIKETVADQTLAVCMIVKDAEADIVRCLRSVVEYAQQIIIAVDRTTKDRTYEEIAAISKKYPLIDWQVFGAESPMDVGFAAARNATLHRADCDWILWIDSDELLHGNPLPMLRANMFNGYALEQHHMSVEPAGIMKTDLPVRFFRNFKGIQFFGYVHEHPETKLNEGLGHVCVMHNVKIMHYGYTDENVRRKRFQRNIGLLVRDRKETPERVLGKFLWLRDLAQVTQYEMEAGTFNLDAARARAEEGAGLWRELVTANLRMAVDSLPYYSALMEFVDGNFEFGFSLDASKMNGGVNQNKAQFVSGRFASMEDATALLKAATAEKLAGFDSRYF